MTVYSTRDIANTIGLSPSVVRSYARSGLVSPERGPRREYRFSFQDVVLLRTARELLAARVHPRKIRKALRALRSQLPAGRPLTAVRIVADGDAVVVKDGSTVWNPLSRQVLFDFDVGDLADKVAPLAREFATRRAEDVERDAERWFALALELEFVAPAEAEEAYRRVLRLDPANADAHANLGRLLHEQDLIADAEVHYRLALEAQPGHATAAFNLGIALEDLGRASEALEAYGQAIREDPGHAEAHYNLGRLLERLGRRAAALRHLARYRRLMEGDEGGETVR